VAENSAAENKNAKKATGVAKAMREIRIGKVTLNMGCGGDKAKMEKAGKLLTMLTNRKPIATLSKRRSTFGTTKGKPVGMKVTLRGKQAEDMLRLALTGVENKLKSGQFDKSGNFSFGIKEYIDMSDVKYSHEIGMLGFDVTVTLERPGFCIKKRGIRQSEIGGGHKITPEEAMQWLREKFGVQIAE